LILISLLSCSPHKIRFDGLSSRDFDFWSPVAFFDKSMSQNQPPTCKKEAENPAIIYLELKNLIRSRQMLKLLLVKNSPVFPNPRKHSSKLLLDLDCLRFQPLFCRHGSVRALIKLKTQMSPVLDRL